MTKEAESGGDIRRPQIGAGIHSEIVDQPGDQREQDDLIKCAADSWIIVERRPGRCGCGAVLDRHRPPRVLPPLPGRLASVADASPEPQSLGAASPYRRGINGPAARIGCRPSSTNSWGRR